MTANGYKGSFWGDGDVRELDCGDGCTALKIMEPHLGSVTSRVCKSYLHKVHGQTSSVPSLKWMFFRMLDKWGWSTA